MKLRVHKYLRMMAIVNRKVDQNMRLELWDQKISKVRKLNHRSKIKKILSIHSMKILHPSFLFTMWIKRASQIVKETSVLMIPNSPLKTLLIPNMLKQLLNQLKIVLPSVIEKFRDNNNTKWPNWKNSLS